ncbi:unnamed protein product [Protopolystoma xenopodis]|uniref:Uncharacterized protein n=1 Tax=Protopolystoma xenopodis TaxID=117903 RepID=A0A3S5ANC0_9PLAT|nr:unnamed protein product [Protopolystoma xenopodis]
MYTFLACQPVRPGADLALTLAAVRIGSWCGHEATLRDVYERTNWAALTGLLSRRARERESERMDVWMEEGMDNWSSDVDESGRHVQVSRSAETGEEGQGQRRFCDRHELDKSNGQFLLASRCVQSNLLICRLVHSSLGPVTEQQKPGVACSLLGRLSARTEFPLLNGAVASWKRDPSHVGATRSATKQVSSVCLSGCRDRRDNRNPVKILHPLLS